MNANLKEELLENLHMGKVDSVRQILMENPELINAQFSKGSLLHEAACYDNVEMVAMLVDMGSAINASMVNEDSGLPNRALDCAVHRSNVNVTHWLLAHGARGEKSLSKLLVSAVIRQCPEIVKLLVDHGANVNEIDGESTVLSVAMGCKPKEMETFLRSVGAKEAWELKKGTPPPLETALVKDLFEALRNGKVARVQQILTQNPEALRTRYKCEDLLYNAAHFDNVEMVAMLVGLGFDVNCPFSTFIFERPIDAAVHEGQANVARWLLEHGAKVNFEHKGKIRTALETPAMDGNLKMVKLLVEYMVKSGEDLNAACYEDNTPLDLAEAWGHEDVAEYLRSQGAKRREELGGEAPVVETITIVEHLKRYWGMVKPLPIEESPPGDPPIKIHLVEPPTLCPSYIVLATEGMSARAMTVPKGKGGWSYRYAECVIFLPATWPLTKKALKDPNNSWPVEWLRKIARWPHQNHTWLGGEYCIIANGDPPQPLAPNVKFTSIMAHVKSGDAGAMVLTGNRPMVFYVLTPLYSEERELEKEKGMEELLRRFHEIRDDATVDIHRPNVALAGSKPAGQPKKKGKKGK